MNIKDLEQKLKNQQKGRTIGKKLKDLPSPSMLKNCIPLAKQIKERLMRGERMLVAGDYDADGILGTAAFMSFIRDLGFTEDIVDFIIPNRLKDGYGISQNIIEYAKSNNFDFIMTIDNGISAVEAVKLSNEYGIPVYITDHHTAPEILPEAELIVNPKVPGETFPFKEISGATVAWYVAVALRAEFNVQIDMRKYLDYIGITILSDVMPLDDINLAILDYAMKQIKDRKRYIYQLIWNDYTAPTINTTEISFSLVPKINAIGRINDANIGVRLFMNKKKEEIKELYEYISNINDIRKEMSRNSTQKALDYVYENGFEKDSVIIVRNKDFHEGIVGIIAGKLAEKFRRPAYVFSYNKEKDIWKGSARSVANIHLYELTSAAKEFILGFGGHKGAVGLAVTENNWEQFVSSIKEAGNSFSEKDFEDESLVPISCSIADINEEVIDLLNKYGPFGQGNPEPVFLAEDIDISIEREMKNGLHFKTIVSDDTGSSTALFFNVNKEDFLKKIEEDEKSILFYPSLKYDLRKEKFSHELICSLF